MAKPRILLIEDERGLTDVLTYNLQREGYETIVAHDGTEGLRKAQMQLLAARSWRRRRPSSDW